MSLESPSESRPEPQDEELARRLNALADEHPETTSEAAAWLAEHADRSAPALARIARAARDDQTTRWALRIIGDLSREEDVPLLANLLRRPGPAWEAAQALAKDRAPSALPALLEALAYSDAEVVGAVAVALGVRGDQAARPALEALLQHDAEDVRYRAVHALDMLDAGDSSGPLREAQAREASTQVRDFIAEVLARNA